MWVCLCVSAATGCALSSITSWTCVCADTGCALKHSEPCVFLCVLVKAAHWVTMCHVSMCVCCYRQYIEPQWAVFVSVCAGICWALTHSDVCGCECAGLGCALHHSEQCVWVFWYSFHSESQWVCASMCVCLMCCAFIQSEPCDVLQYKLYTK